MEGKQKTIIICISLLFVALVGWAVWSALTREEPLPLEKQPTPSTNQKTPNKSDTGEDMTMPEDDTTLEPGERPSDEMITTVITRDNPGLVDSKTNIPNFTITSSSQPLPGWYVASIRNTAVTTSDARVVMRSINNKLVIIAGPGTGLTADKSLPQEVREALYQ